MSSSTIQYLREVISEDTAIGEKVNLLNTQVFPDIVEEFNTGDAADRLTRLTRDIEPIPDHSLNVTETRTRVGVLFETSIGKIISDYLPDEYTVSYGVSQAQTDVIIRGGSQHPSLRFEVKAIEDISEEKAASYEDLVHSIDPTRDILVILSWGWHRDCQGGTEIRSPYFYDLQAFEMREISLARDILWVQNPNSENMIDVSMPVLRESPRELKEEGGNFGKLTRIVDRESLDDNPELCGLLDFDELIRYSEYMEFCMGKGIERAAEYYMERYGYFCKMMADDLLYNKNRLQLVSYAKDTTDNSNLLIFSGGNKTMQDRDLTFQTEYRIGSIMDVLGIADSDILIIKNEKFDWSYANAEFGDFEIPYSIITTVEDQGPNLLSDKERIGRSPI